jgi:AraC-like DNA-binding protein
MQVNLSLTNSVKDIIKENGFSMVTIDDVESVLGLHKRIIQRQLEEQGTSFRQLKEEVLKEQSLFLLMHEILPINKVAEILKYSEPSAFHRAFKKWFGVSPKQYCVKPFY